MSPEITFRDMEPSEAMEAAIRVWAAKLELVCPIDRCAVVIDMPHKHHHHHTFRIHLTISVPGRSIAVARPANDNAYHGVAEAFRAARRQLIDFIAQRREARPTARVAG